MSYWKPDDLDKDEGPKKNGNGSSKAIVLLALTVLGGTGVTGVNQWMLHDYQKRVLDKVDQIPALIEQGNETNRRLNDYQKALDEERQERKEADKENFQYIRIVDERTRRP